MPKAEKKTVVRKFADNLWIYADDVFTVILIVVAFVTMIGVLLGYAK